MDVVFDGVVSWVVGAGGAARWFVMGVVGAVGFDGAGVFGGVAHGDGSVLVDVDVVFKSYIGGDVVVGDPEGAEEVCGFVAFVAFSEVVFKSSEVGLFVEADAGEDDEDDDHGSDCVEDFGADLCLLTMRGLVGW